MTVYYQGTATLIDGLTQIAIANQGLQLSFAKGYDDWKKLQPTVMGRLLIK